MVSCLKINNDAVANKDQADIQMPINQTAQACIISQLTLEESPQVERFKCTLETAYFENMDETH